MRLLGYSVEAMLASLLDAVDYAAHVDMTFQTQQLLDGMLETILMDACACESEPAMAQRKGLSTSAPAEAQCMETLVSQQSSDPSDELYMQITASCLADAEAWTTARTLLDELLSNVLSACESVQCPQQDIVSAAAEGTSTALSSDQGHPDVSKPRASSKITSFLDLLRGSTPPPLVLKPRKRLRLDDLPPQQRKKGLFSTEAQHSLASSALRICSEEELFPASQNVKRVPSPPSPPIIDVVENAVKNVVDSLIALAIAQPADLEAMRIRWNTFMAEPYPLKKQKRVKLTIQRPESSLKRSLNLKVHETDTLPSSDLLLPELASDGESSRSVPVIKKRRKFSAPLSQKPMTLSTQINAPPRGSFIKAKPLHDVAEIDDAASKSTIFSLEKQFGPQKRSKAAFSVPAAPVTQPASSAQSTIDSSTIVETPINAASSVGSGGWETALGKKLDIKRDPALAAEWGSASPAQDSEQIMLAKQLKALSFEKTQLQRQIARLKDDVKVCERAASLIAADEATRLEQATRKWREVCRAGCEEMLESARRKIDMAGGFRAWRDGMTTAGGGGFGGSWGWQEVTRQEEFPMDAEMKAALGISEEEESFSMEMMLAQFGVPLSLVGWDGDLLRWQQ